MGAAHLGSIAAGLQLRDGTVVVADDDSKMAIRRGMDRAHCLQMTNGTSYPGSPSALPGALTTAASYDQSLGAAGRLLIAGEMSYDRYDQLRSRLLRGLKAVAGVRNDLAA